MPSRSTTRTAFGALVLLACVAFAPLTAAAACTPVHVGLASPATLFAGPSPTGIVAADFDRDGHMDVVVALSHLGYLGDGNGNMAFLRGRGDGTFNPPTAFGSGNTPFFVATGDVNGDGKLDVVATYISSNTLGVMLGDGAGGFSAPTFYWAGSRPHHVVLADVNADGILDIIVADTATPTVVVLLGYGTNGVGNGSFAPYLSFALGNVSTGLAVADVNGDGKLDVVATESSSGTLGVLLGLGNGTFQLVYQPACGGHPYDVTLADVNGDGILDAVVTLQGDGMRILPGVGNGSFGLPAPSGLLAGSGSTVRVRDVDGDGLLDLVVTVSDANKVLLLCGHGTSGVNDGTFQVRSERTAPGFPMGLALADFNEDGMPDAMVTGYNFTDVSLLVAECAALPRVFVIDHVYDVPNDQGGRVWLTWPAHLEDVPAGRITGYRVWRRIPVAAAAARAAGTLRMRMAAGGPTYWEAAASLPAQRLAAYGYTAATPQDSLAGGNPYTAFFVTATTTSADVFFDTPVDSGYSVDNLAPSAPAQLVAHYGPGSVTLAWSAGLEPDLFGYRVHRGASAFFVPGPLNLVGQPATGSFVDTASPDRFYKVAAVDVHGNVGPYVLVQPDAPVGIDVTLVSSAIEPGRVTLTWYADAHAIPFASLERDDGDGAWRVVAAGAPDGGGWLVLNDDTVAPGASYRYRLSWIDADGTHTSGLVEITMPGLALALAGARPNPAGAGALSVHFTLKDASPATLEFFDVGGRRVLGRPVGALGAGDHVLELGSARLRPGLYLARLTQRGEQRHCRIAIVR